MNIALLPLLAALMGTAMQVHTRSEILSRPSVPTCRRTKHSEPNQLRVVGAVRPRLFWALHRGRRIERPPLALTCSRVSQST
jgi:hypothetical protein